MMTFLNLVGFVVGLIALVAFVLLIIAGFKRSVLWGIVVLLIPLGTLIYALKYWQEVKKPFLVFFSANMVSYAIFYYFFSQIGGMDMINMAQKIEDGTMTDQDAAIFMQNTMTNIEGMGGGGKEDMIAQMRADPNVTEEQIKMMEAMFGEIEAVASGESASFEEGMEQRMREIEREAASNKKTIKDYIELASDTSESENTAAQAREVIDPKSLHDEPIAPPTRAATAQPAPTVEKQKAETRKKTGPISLAEANKYIGRSVVVMTDTGVTHKATILGFEKSTLMLEKRSFGGTLSFNIPAGKIESIKLD